MVPRPLWYWPKPQHLTSAPLARGFCFALIGGMASSARHRLGEPAGEPIIQKRMKSPAHFLVTA